MTYCIITSTAPNKQEAITIAEYLVKNNLIACCNIIDNITSIYVWDGQLNKDIEVLMIIKTKTQLYAKVEEEIKRLHSYEIPEIICTPIIAGSKEYLNWLEEQTTKG